LRDLLAGEFADAVEVCPAAGLRLVEDKWDGWVKVRTSTMRARLDELVE